MCNSPPPPAGGSEVGGSSVQTVGIVSIEEGDFQQLGLGRGEKRFGISFDRILLKINEIGNTPVDLFRVTDLVSLSGGIGLARGLSLWGQIPLGKNRDESRWTMGNPAFGLRWRPGVLETERGVIVYVNEGLVVPLGESLFGSYEDPSLGQIDAGRTPAAQSAYLNRAVTEVWIDSKKSRLFGLQFLWDFPLNRASGGIHPGEVLQLSLHTIDRRFAGPGFVPYLALIYRNQGPDKKGGREIENSEGWFIHGIAALTVRLSPDYRVTVSTSGPLMIGIVGADLSQTNFGISLFWQPD